MDEMTLAALVAIALTALSCFGTALTYDLKEAVEKEALTADQLQDKKERLEQEIATNEAKRILLIESGVRLNQENNALKNEETLLGKSIQGAKEDLEKVAVTEAPASIAKVAIASGSALLLVAAVLMGLQKSGWESLNLGAFTLPISSENIQAAAIAGGSIIWGGVMLLKDQPTQEDRITQKKEQMRQQRRLGELKASITQLASTPQTTNARISAILPTISEELKALEGKGLKMTTRYAAQKGFAASMLALSVVLLALQTWATVDHRSLLKILHLNLAGDFATAAGTFSLTVGLGLTAVKMWQNANKRRKETRSEGLSKRIALLEKRERAYRLLSDGAKLLGPKKSVAPS
jgi:hypothetical protein